MLTTNLMQRQIMDLKKEKGVTILAHNFVSQVIQEIACHVAGSYALTELAQRSRNQTLIICGSRYIAETCKVLCPKKKILLVNEASNCPMADKVTANDVRLAKKKYPGYTTVCYINTNADIKALCDACVTSNTAVNSCRKLPGDKILFLPDVNLGAYIASKIPEKEFAFVDGCCPAHSKVTAEEAIKAITAHPDAKILAHPTCNQGVLKLADYIGSTNEIINYAHNSNSEEFIIATEISVAEHLQYALPEKRFYPLSKKIICHDMKIMTLHDVLDCLMERGGTEIVLSAQVQLRSLISINKMFELNG